MIHTNNYLDALSAQFRQIFLLSKAGKDNTTERLRTQGFIQAGELLQQCTKADVQNLMQQIHHEVFGCSIEQRLNHNSNKSKRQQALSSGDYEYFDEPTVIRVKES